MSVPLTGASALRHIASSRLVTWSGSVLLVIALVAIVGPWLSPHAYQDTDFDGRLMAPTLEGLHLFGTDDLGRDLFVRTLSGTRVTLLVAVVASLVSLVIGVAWGAIAGYAGGRVDALMMRIVDALYALPFIFLVILLMVAFERNFLLIFVAIGAINWLDMARIVRGQTLSLKHREFVEAAEALGVSTFGLLRRHIVPNLLGVVAVYVTLTIPQVILVESFLSFLGLGPQNSPSWGALLDQGASYFLLTPHLAMVPGFAIMLSVLGLNFLGDALRDVLDPRAVTQSVTTQSTTSP